MSEQLIEVSRILDPEWNSRLWTESATEKQETVDLAESIHANGLLQAISVEDTGDGNFLLVLGSRRLRAVKLMGEETIRAVVNPPTDTTTRVVRNIIENVKRKDLSSFEQARACAKLRELGLSGAEIGDRLGFSKQKVSNLAISYNTLQATPNILAEWQANHPAATVDYLRELATRVKSIPKDTDPIEFLNEEWEARKELLEEASEIVDPPPPAESCKGRIGGKPCRLDKGHEGEHEPVREPSDPPYKVPPQRYLDLVRAVQKSKVAGGQLVVLCMKYLIGETDKVKGIIEPEASAAE